MANGELIHNNTENKANIFFSLILNPRFKLLISLFEIKKMKTLDMPPQKQDIMLALYAKLLMGRYLNMVEKIPNNGYPGGFNIPPKLKAAVATALEPGVI